MWVRDGVILNTASGGRRLCQLLKCRMMASLPPTNLQELVPESLVAVRVVLLRVLAKFTDRCTVSFDGWYTIPGHRLFSSVGGLSFLIGLK